MSAISYVPESFPRRWLPEAVELKTWDQIEPWYAKLLDRPIESVEALEGWLRDLGELNGAVDQEGVARYIATTCQTDDPVREATHKAWVREVEPNLKPTQNALRSKYLDCPHRAGLPRGRYEVYDRVQENRRALYRDANVARETRLEELKQEYQKIIGAQTVTFRGREYTPAQMAPFYEEPDRATRREAWDLVAGRRLQDRETQEVMFDEMLKLRSAIGREAGFETYTQYAYRLRERFDYGVEQAEAFQESIARLVVPLVVDLQERRKRSLGVDSLRPWDLAVDVKSRPPLRPFRDADQLAEGTQQIFADVDLELGAQFAFLRMRGLLDLANRKGKAPGGYQETLKDDRLPFIFMNAVGIDGDLRTLLHEGGHAFHALASRREPLAEYREAPIEFCEVASMSMELLGARRMAMFYGPADADRSYRQLLEGIVQFFPWMATVDAFQHWLYDHPDHDREQRRTAWSALVDRYGGIVDWSGHEEAREHSWHRQLHIFLYPFYYIEYGIAQLGALQVWRNTRENRAEAVAAYRRGLSLGGSRPLPELFEAAGIRFDFSEETLRSLVDSVREELDRLGD